MRRTRDLNVHAVVTLGDTFMKTKWGGRQRPHFKIVRWVRLGGEAGVEVAALPPATTPVQEPSVSEDLNDALPDDLAPPKPAKASKAAFNRKRTNTLEAG
jgi:hypothetical protein